jgi:hypothetical protein
MMESWKSVDIRKCNRLGVIYSMKSEVRRDVGGGPFRVL